MTATLALALLVSLLVGALLGLVSGLLWARSRGEAPDTALAAQAAAEAADRAVVRDGLSRLEERLLALDQGRVAWQSGLQAALDQQVDEMRHSTDLLRRETNALSTALRRPQVRGRWGELHLRRAVEIAGLVDRCDFTEQVSTRDAHGALLRPDLVVHLAGGREVVVDSKVPLEGFLDACECPEDQTEEREAHLRRHARHVRQHVETLGSKAYWRALPGSPEIVVLFMPGESFLAAALESDPALLDWAAERRVVLATPTTLIALLRTVAHAWTEQAVSDQAKEIHRLGRELHERLASMTGHLDKLGRALTGAVTAYNSSIGSLESRVLVSSRRFADLGVVGSTVDAPALVDLSPRVPTPAELVQQDPASTIPFGVAGEETG
jgi:DNA recombination protein RmuC